MMKRLFVFGCLTISLAALVISILSYQKAQATSVSDQQYKEKIIRLVQECIDYNPATPKKAEISTLLDELKTKGFILEQGSDDLRVKFVTAQGCIEHALACMQALSETHELIGMIHTPTPATPLCTKPEPLDSGLLDASIRYDLDKLLTVRSRAHIVREYLHKGGKLHIVYPQGGLEKRTPEQQAIFKEELVRFAGNLFESVLTTTKMDPDMVGATYFFRNGENRIFSFSIKARQANDPAELSEWGMWLSQVDEPHLRQRIELLFSYLETYDGPNRKIFNL